MKHNPEIFYRSSCTDVSFDDYLLLGGGSDIDPSIYGEVNHGYCQSPNKTRDRHNVSEIHRYVSNGLPIIGICRGHQLLDAVFGGKLIQHTVGHSSLVSVKTADSIPWEEGEIFDHCRSCHHQVVSIKATKGKIIGWSDYNFNSYLSDGTISRSNIVPQIIYWPEKKSLSVQFHPEWQGGDHEMNRYLRGLIKELLGLENVL